MLRIAALSLLALVADAAIDKRAMQMSRFNSFPVKEFRARVDTAVKNRRLQETFCEIFQAEIQNIDDDVISSIECACTETQASFEISCVTEDLCVEHTTGDMSKYTGDLTLGFAGDFSDPNNVALSDSLCFKYDEGTEACLNDSFVGETCTITDGGSQCESCAVCDAESGFVAFTCNGVSVDECGGDTLEGSPLQFYGSDTETCVATDMGTDMGEPPAASATSASVGYIAAVVMAGAVAMM